MDSSRALQTERQKALSRIIRRKTRSVPVGIKQQIERLEEADKSFYVTATYLLQLFKHGEKIFEVASHDEKRELLKLLLSNLELKGKTVRFTPNEPFATVLKLSERSTWQGY